MPDIVYPFDTSGRAPTNLITDEMHTVTEANFRDYFFIVPNFSPFYIENFRILYYVNGEERALTEGIDFNFALEYVAGTRTTGKPMYGAITLNNLDLAGILKIRYQTLGGNLVANRWYVLQFLAEKAYNPRTTIWDVVTDKPDIFPPIPHYQDYDNFYGQEEMVNAINNLARSIIENRDENPFIKHITDYNNPHKVTKEQIGLGNVENWSLATREEAAAGTSFDTLITPFTLNYALQNYQIDVAAIDNLAKITAYSLQDHVHDFDNPHLVTKEQVGLGLVENYPVASDMDILNRQRANKYITLRQLFDVYDVINAQYTVVTDRLVYSDDDIIHAKFDSINLTPGKVLYWRVEHLTTDPSLFLENEGSLILDQFGVGYFDVRFIPELLIAPNLKFKLSVRLGNTEGTVITQTPELTVNFENTPVFTEDIRKYIREINMRIDQPEKITPAIIFIQGEDKADMIIANDDEGGALVPAPDPNENIILINLNNIVFVNKPDTNPIKLYLDTFQKFLY